MNDEKRKPLPTGARVAVAVCVLGMAAVALWPPYEIMGDDLEPVGTVRRSVFAERAPGEPVRRLHLWRLLLEEGLIIGVAIAVVVTFRPPAPRRREPDIFSNNPYPVTGVSGFSSDGGGGGGGGGEGGA